MEQQGPLESERFGELPRYPIESVDKALRLLSLFLTRDRVRGLDAAQALGVGTGTAHRLLAMLRYRGYVTQDPVSRAYLPGTMLLMVGLKAAGRLDLRRTARPYLERLRDEFDETVQLGTLQGTEAFFIDGVESTRTLRVSSRAGTMRPAHCTSIGKVLLAELSEEGLMEMYPSGGELPRCTPQSIGSLQELLHELEEVRARGYSVNAGELEEGIGSVAAAIRDTHGRAVAAIGAGAPLFRLDDGLILQMSRAIRQAADEVQRALAL